MLIHLEKMLSSLGPADTQQYYKGNGKIVVISPSKNDAKEKNM